MPSLLYPLLFCLVLGIASAPGMAAADDDPYYADRKLFLEARAALNSGKRSTFRELKAQLENYPLAPYLDYWEKRRYLGVQGSQDIQAFLDRHADTPMAKRLRRAWLYQLAKQKKWETYLTFYRAPQPVNLQCYALRAQLKTGQREGLLDQAEALWLVGHSQPSACDPVFDVLYASNRITPQLIWQRIYLAMDNNKLALAKFLAKKLSPEDRAWVEHWQVMHRRPAETLKDHRLQEDIPIVHDILMHGLRRLARHNPEEAWAHWDRLRGQFHFDKEKAAQLERRMALSAAYNHHPRTLEWIERVSAPAADDTLQQWRIRAALATRSWDSILDASEAMTPQEQQQPAWRYWRAQALFSRDQRMDALKLLGELATERNYYGFLAADFLDWQYAMNDAPITATQEELAALEARPALVRARELYRAKLTLDARREWFHDTSQLTPRQLQLAARLADSWGWHDRAIISAAKADHFSDLALRFPTAHRQQVFDTAKHLRLDPSLIYGVIRQESAFMHDAHSSAGALGLMQLMPSTGRMTAKHERIRLPNTSALLQSDKNIRIGSAYLKRMLDDFEQNPALATAAYNAGPHRVKRWRPDSDQPTAVWIERIPFTETRKYVRNVLAYSTIFDWRLNRPIKRLADRVPETVKADPS